MAAPKAFITGPVLNIVTTYEEETDFMNVHQLLRLVDRSTGLINPLYHQITLAPAETYFAHTETADSFKRSVCETYREGGARRGGGTTYMSLFLTRGSSVSPVEGSESRCDDNDDECARVGELVDHCIALWEAM